MRVRIYQPDGSGRTPAGYRCVFHGDVEARDPEGARRLLARGDVPYAGSYQGRPLSDGDVIEVVGRRPGETAEPGCYRRGPDGWTRRPDFDPSLCAGMEGVRALMLLPGREPAETRIVDDLAHWQRAVSRNGEDALMEVTYPFPDNAVVVSNEEAKLVGMEGNRRVNGSVYAGPMYIVGDDGRGGFCDLTDRQARAYAERFRRPEVISQEEVEADVGFEISAL